MLIQALTLPQLSKYFFESPLDFGGFPFDVRIEAPNKEATEAVLEEEFIAYDPSVKRHSDIDEALWNLKD